MTVEDSTSDRYGQSRSDPLPPPPRILNSVALVADVVLHQLCIRLLMAPRAAASLAVRPRTVRHHLARAMLLPLADHFLGAVNKIQFSREVCDIFP